MSISNINPVTDDESTSTSQNIETKELTVGFML